jgi:NAD(P)H-dependent flavin oxidoreductase YrpB (nitropropane dioxygenase family)
MRAHSLLELVSTTLFGVALGTTAWAATECPETGSFKDYIHNNNEYVKCFNKHDYTACEQMDDDKAKIVRHGVIKGYDKASRKQQRDDTTGNEERMDNIVCKETKEISGEVQMSWTYDFYFRGASKAYPGNATTIFDKNTKKLKEATFAAQATP